MEKKAPGEEREIFGRGEFRVRVYIYADVYAEMRLSVCVTRFFFLAMYLLFSLSRRKLKKKPEIVYSSCFFFYKEVYLLIVIF
jgi:hypothetical protein